jgi:glycosyltransferase involved in cell wall biosynthesis
VHEKLLSDNGVFLHYLGDHNSINPLLFIRADDLIKDSKPDIIQTWLPQMDVVGGVAALWNSIPWIISERTSEDSYKGWQPFIRARRLLARHAKAVVANSVGGFEYWRKAGVKGTKVFRIANAIDGNAVRNAVAQGQNSKGSVPEIIVVGRLEPVKAVAVIVQALSLVPADLLFHVSVVGDGRMRDEIAFSIDRFGIGNRVSLCPYDPSWWSRLKSASLLISMSRYEGQPNVVLETMASGCPLIVSDIPAHRELLDESSAVFVQLDDSQSLAEAIASHFADLRSAKNRAELARSRVDAMTIQVTADAYQTVYTRLLGDYHK